MILTLSISGILLLGATLMVLADRDVAEHQTTAVVVTLRQPTALGIVPGFVRKEKITSNADRLTQCGMLGADESE
jgi:hypothetical protein